MSNAKAIVKAFTATVGLILVVGIITASAQTSQFVSMMRNARVFFADGTLGSPSVASTTSTGTGLWWPAANTLGIQAGGLAQVRFVASNIVMKDVMNLGWSSTSDPQGTIDTLLCRGAANVIGIGGCTSSFPALTRSGNSLNITLGDNTGFTAINVGALTWKGAVLIGATAPTISSGFGTSPSIVNSNSPAAFTVNVGTGGVATSGVIGLPTATTGWSCFANDRTNNTVTRQTATTTTSATFTAAAAWAASDILNISCFGY
jgi:hypothetical protein